MATPVNAKLIIAFSPSLSLTMASTRKSAANKRNKYGTILKYMGLLCFYISNLAGIALHVKNFKVFAKIQAGAF